MLLFREYKLRLARQMIASHDEQIFYFLFSMYVWNLNKTCMLELTFVAAKLNIDLETLKNNDELHPALKDFGKSIQAWFENPAELETVHDCYIAAVQVKKYHLNKLLGQNLFRPWVKFNICRNELVSAY